jgi:hypothetical protein
MEVVAMKYRVIVINDVRNGSVREQPFDPGRKPREKLIFDPKEMIMTAVQERV